MAMGERKQERQESLFVTHQQLPRTQGHPFYQRLNKMLETEGFDEFVQRGCGKFYAKVMGRPGVAPGVYFRMLLVGYFEGIDSERGIAWRCADSLSLRDFLGCELTGDDPVEFLFEDGDENRNLAADRPDEVEAMRRLLADVRAAIVPVSIPAPTQSLSPEENRMLSELGYVETTP